MFITVILSCCLISCDEKEQPAGPGQGPAQDTVTPAREFVLTPDRDGTLVIDNRNNKYQPGDVLSLKGNFTGVSVTNLNGSAAAPIIVRNQPGAVTRIGNPDWNGGAWAGALTFSNCHHVVIGSTSNKSEFVINGSTTGAREAYFDLILRDHTDNVEVRNLTITNGGNGILAKTDPVKGDPSTWYPNEQLENLSIHDVEITGTNNEAMYIGHTATYWDLTGNVPYYGAPSGFAAGHEYVQPIKWRNVKIYNNRVSNIGADGIQTAATDQLEIYGNEVSNWATQHNSAHNGGILIGGRTTNTNTHDNYVHDGWGELLQFYGSGENGATHTIHNNLFRDNQVQNDGVSLRGSNNAVVHVTHNTIARTGGVCLRINGYFGMTAAQIVQSNAFIQPKTGGGPILSNAYIYTENGGTVTEGKGGNANTSFPTVAAAKVDINNFYQPVSGSPLSASGYRKH